MTHLTVGIFVIAFPIAAVLFGLFAMGVITLRKARPPETPPKPANLRPPPRPKMPEPQPVLTEKEKRRAARRAKKRDL
jgi:hypothetical protein